jgi:DNA-binding transcriptional LysR family regulator
VIGRRLAPAALLHGFHQAHPRIGLDVVTLFDADTAIAAIRAGTVDAAFRAVTMPGRQLPGDIRAAPVLDEPLLLLTGPAHPLAGAASVTPGQLAGHRIWIPGIVAGTEWAAYYEALAAAFGLTIDSDGPNFSMEPVLDAIAAAPDLATFTGAQTQLSWPDGHDLRRIPVRGPVPVYPHSLIWRGGNPHPALAKLRAHLGTITPSPEAWAPGWSRPPALAG